MRHFLLFILFFFHLCTGLLAQTWSKVGLGDTVFLPKSGIDALACDTSNNIYASAYAAESDGLYYIYKWDGIKWQKHGPGLSDRVKQLICSSTNELYVQSQFCDSTGCYMSKWNGVTYELLNSGEDSATIQANIYTLTTGKESNLYAAGSIHDTLNYLKVMNWNGSKWKSLGVGNHRLKANNGIYALLCDSAGNVYASGTFTDSLLNTKGHFYIAKWNGNDWSRMDAGPFTQNFNGPTIALANDSKGNIYAAGTFTNDSNRLFVAKWNGLYWVELVGLQQQFMISRMANYVFDLSLDSKDNLYLITDAVGKYTSAFAVAKWDGTNWFDLSLGTNGLRPNNLISQIVIDKLDNVYVSGTFTDSAKAYLGHNFVAKYGTSTAGIQPTTASGHAILFPNPSNSLYHIQFNSMAHRKIQVYNIIGQCIFQTDCTTNSYTLDALIAQAAGFYFLKIIDAESNNGELIKLIKD